MKRPSLRAIALGVGLLGAGFAVSMLLPLPPTADIQAARRWGVGVSYLGFILGFPLSIIGVPAIISLNPFPVGNDASGASTIAATMAMLVGLNWALLTLGAVKVIRRLRTRRDSRR